jgi:hypothetical protein
LRDAGVLWLAVHLFALTGFKNRVAVLFDWTIAFLGRGRPRITAQQVTAVGAAFADRPASSTVRRPEHPR